MHHTDFFSRSKNRIPLRSTNRTEILIDYLCDADNRSTISSRNIWVNVIPPPGRRTVRKNPNPGPGIRREPLLSIDTLHHISYECNTLR